MNHKEHRGHKGRVRDQGRSHKINKNYFFTQGKLAIYTAFPAVMKHGRDTALPCPYGD
jgi:hypothetical protein